MGVIELLEDIGRGADIKSPLLRFSLDLRRGDSFWITGPRRTRLGRSKIWRSRQRWSGSERTKIWRTP